VGCAGLKNLGSPETKVDLGEKALYKYKDLL
jgi:hypothetical protein